MKATNVRRKCMSLQTLAKGHGEILASNNSAPCDLNFNKEDHTFAFTKYVCNSRPSLLIDSIVNEADVVNIIKILQFEINKKQSLGNYLIKKDIIDKQNVTEKEFLTLLFIEATDYAAQKDFSGLKLACLLNIYISTHNYMKTNDWKQPKEIWAYFKEVLVRLTIEDSPDGQEVFSPEESYDILSHFHTIYMNNLPLVHILVFGAHKLRLFWPSI